MKENIANAFIVNPNGIKDYEIGVPMANIENAITITMPHSKDKKPELEILTKEDLKRLEETKNKLQNIPFPTR